MHIQDKRAAFLKKERTDKNMTQRQFAEKIFVTANAVSKWERGESFPDTDRLLLIAQVFQCTVDELLDGARRPCGVADSTACGGAEDIHPMPAPAETAPEPAPDVPRSLPPADADETAIQPFPSRAGPKRASSVLRRPVKLVLSASILSAMATGLLVLYCRFTPPSFEIIHGFYGDRSDTLYFDNAYCLAVEYSGRCGEADMDAFCDSIKEEYHTILDEVDALVIMFFQHYDPETDYIDTADYRINLLSPHQN